MGLSGPYTANIRDYRSIKHPFFKESVNSPFKIRDYRRSLKPPPLSKFSHELNRKFRNYLPMNATMLNHRRRRRSINSRLKAGADFFKRLSVYSKLKWKRKKISKQHGGMYDEFSDPNYDSLRAILLTNLKYFQTPSGEFFHSP